MCVVLDAMCVVLVRVFYTVGSKGEEAEGRCGSGRQSGPEIGEETGGEEEESGKHEDEYRERNYGQRQGQRGGTGPKPRNLIGHSQSQKVR